MNGIVTLPPTDILAPDTPPGPDDAIDVDAFWPSISIAALRDAEKIGTDIPDARLRLAIVNAALDVSRELRAWRTRQEAALHVTLAEVPPRQIIGGVSDYVILWARAVQSVVAADLGERALTQSSTATGSDRAEDALTQAQRQQRNVRHAVRDFLGKTRVRAALL